MAKPKLNLKQNVHELKKYWQIIYAALLIFLVPLAIIANTTWVVRSFQGDIDVELKREVLSISEMFNAALMDDLENYDKLQLALERARELNPQLKFADILVPEGEEFRVVATINDWRQDTLSKDLLNVFAWYKVEAHTIKTNAAILTQGDPLAIREYENLQEQFWTVVTPLVDEEGTKKALLRISLSTAFIDSIVAQTYVRSMIVLAFTVVIVILLLLANTRLFQYAVLAKKLKEVEKLKDEFISMASHELRTPITSLRGYLSMMHEGALGDMTDLAQDKVTMMLASADRLNELVEDLLNVSRIEQGRLTISFEIIQIEPIVEAVMDELRVQADEKSLQFVYEKPEEPLPPLLIDSKRLRQILVNIIGNSIKYTPQGSVKVTTIYKPEDGVVEVKCADTGLGMTQKQRERLFQKFYRVKSAQTEHIKGTGLGLWITKQLIELMDGEILVDSIKDVGTQMAINFPVKNEKAMALALSKQDQDVKMEAKKVHEDIADKAKQREEENRS